MSDLGAVQAVEVTWDDLPMGKGWEHLDPDAVIWIDVATFDQAWSETDQYIRPGGADGQGDRYARAGEWFAIHTFSDMLVVWMNDDGVGFTEGRHRFSWLRDQGVEALPVQMSPDRAEAFARRFGTDKRRTDLKRIPQARDLGRAV